MCRNHRIVCATSLFLLSAALLVRAAAAQEAPTADELAFTAGENGVFTFDTGVLQGRLRGDGRAFGLNAATHVPSGQVVSGAYGVLGVYRVFSDGKRYGNAGWEWPSDAARNPDGSVTVAVCGGGCPPVCAAGPVPLEVALGRGPGDPGDAHSRAACVRSLRGLVFR